MKDAHAKTELAKVPGPRESQQPGRCRLQDVKTVHDSNGNQQFECDDFLELLPRDKDLNVNMQMGRKDGTRSRDSRKLSTEKARRKCKSGQNGGDLSREGSITGHKLQMIVDPEYFHGFLPPEDLPAVLVEVGDFLVRMADVAAESKGPQYAISVRVAKVPPADKPPVKPSEKSCMSVKPVEKDRSSDQSTDTSADKTVEDCKEPIRSIVVQKINKEWAVESKTFKTITELIEHHMSTKTPLLSDRSAPPIVLKKPISRQPWELKPTDVDTKEQLGSGAFGVVMKGTLRKGKKKIPVAVKVMQGDKNMADREKMRVVMKEARVMRKFDHCNVVRLYGVVIEREPFMIVMELIEGQALDKYLRENFMTVTDTERVHQMCAAAAYGLEYLHGVGVIHRDIAARNCLYHKRKTLKISDFGLTCEGEAYKITSSRVLPVRWLSPESMEIGLFTAKSDVYSYGILIWEIYNNGNEPYVGYNNRQISDLVMRGKRLEMPPLIPENISDCVRNYAWPSDPNDRWTMSEFCAFFEREYKTEPAERRKEKPGKDTKKKISELKKKLSKNSNLKNCDDITETLTAETKTMDVSVEGDKTKRNKTKNKKCPRK
uniref:Tyrosine-protein kinase n=1 Tax=Steinernema glaseri TaxID=37863 RepID=A0A1I7ZRL0_9BILA